MSRLLLVFLALLSGPLLAQTDSNAGSLVGRMDGKTYVSATGAFRIAIPVLPELGGRISDTEKTVTFQDDYNFFCTIAALQLDATQRWELATRGTKDYLAYFFANFVMPDFQETYRGSHVETAVFAPGIHHGALLVYNLLPGGSMFSHRLALVDPNEKLPDAKRGNLLIVEKDWVFIVSTELSERVLERLTYRKTTSEENEILRKRLTDLLSKIEFTLPEPATSPPVAK
jgi:hypothetical protein